MQEKQYFWVNQNIEVADLEEKAYYKTIVQEVLPDSISIAIPMKSGNYFLPEDGSMIKGCFVFDEALYVFETRVIDRLSGDIIPLIKLDKPQRLYRRQRRNYYRHPIFLSMDYKLLQDNDDTKKWYRTKTINIGGGGIKFINDKSFLIGTEMKIRLYLTRSDSQLNEIIEAESRVVRVAPSSTKGYKHSVSIMFTNIQERQRDRIISFIFLSMKDKVR
ncbi:flagellar brake protein [Candidatus Contubernalis alkaliaceticus]|uniref:flagellar brake protein n=1 Tax=Candidatus Contubernalis alkaliaceticus TaxID=338645 RepID=UPI001F4BF347|nr:flagellar brake protein [Candidatus Contubernalis alkalaceticus]UNC91764.1 flagellar brake protein [Candidatus Contubernalis alkalaceticus]